LHNPIDEV
jgi:phage-related protein